jgi:predicted secreted protein
MPTQSLAGYNGVLSISTDNGSSYQVIGELRDVELTIDTDMLDATSHSSAGWKEKVAGNAAWSATAGALYVNADAGQAGVVSALSGKTKCKFRFDPEGTSVGKPRRSGDGYIRNFKETQPTSDLIARSLEIEGTGSLAFSTQ